MKIQKRWLLLCVLVLFPNLAHAFGYSVTGATITLLSGTELITDGDVVISSGLLDATGAMLRVGGDWTKNGGSFIATSSTVSFEGAIGSVSTLSGSTTFYSLQSTVAGKTIVMPAGSTQTVQGQLLLSGILGNRLRVRSSTSGTYAFLVNSGTNTISFVDAQDNNAAGGITIQADSGSTNSGNTVNWFFASGSATTIPKRPEVIRGAIQNSGADFVLNWRAVTLDVSGNPSTIHHYVVQQSTALFGVYATTAASVGGLSYTEPLPGSTYYYRVFAVDGVGATSDASDVIDSSTDLNRYVLPGDNTSSHIQIPDVLNAQLQSVSDGSQDIALSMSRRTQDENTETLRSYSIGATALTSGSSMPSFSFGTPGSSLVMDYASAVTGTTPSVSPYWTNGRNYIQLANPVSPSSSPMSVTSHNMGIYQVSSGQSATGFQLQAGSPYPRVLTPHRSNENRRLFFLFNNPNNDSVSISIYDMRNRLVRHLDPNASNAIPGSIVWDATDSSNRIVSSGVYLYKISAGRTTITGTVVVAR